MKGIPFLVLAIVMTAIDVLVPYLVLATTGSFWASFFFWCVVTLVMIVFAAFHTRSWRNQ